MKFDECPCLIKDHWDRSADPEEWESKVGKMFE